MHFLNRCTAMAAFLALGGLVFTQQASAQADDPAQLTERANDAAPEEDETAWSVNAGAVVNTGNTESWTLNAGTNFRLVRGRHGLGAEWAFNYGRANLFTDGVDEAIDTVRNSNARLRYDFFLSDMDTLFLALSHRWDTFAGLDTRLQGQVGYLRYFLRDEGHKLWGEVGYDITFDNFDYGSGEDPECVETDDAPCTQVVHAARLYVGYDNQINENVRFTTGLEALINVQEIEDLRLNFDAALRSTIAGSLQLELKFKLLFDNVPAPQSAEFAAERPERSTLDTTTTVSLIYTLI